MPPVQIREMNQNTYELLKKSAAESMRSISQQADYIITTYLCAWNQMRADESSSRMIDPVWGVAMPGDLLPCAMPRVRQSELSQEKRVAKRSELLKRLDAIPKRDWTQALDPVALLREDRDGRQNWIIGADGGEA